METMAITARTAMSTTTAMIIFRFISITSLFQLHSISKGFPCHFAKTDISIVDRIVGNRFQFLRIDLPIRKNPFICIHIDNFTDQNAIIKALAFAFQAVDLLTKDFSELIEHAKRCAPPIGLETGEIVGGFAHNQVIALADQIVDAVKSGAIRKFVVMAGCDGRAKSRSYYTDFAQALPKDTVILTAGCAKYRYNKLNLGDINGIPRVLDAGQCNDSYSLAVIAMKLQEVFGLEDINELPIIYNIAWYEQKAVIVLLALLSLGVKNIHLGPTLPAFLSPNVTKILVNNFGIAGISSVEEDMELFFGK